MPETITETDLDQFSGTEIWYPHWAGTLVYTEGLKFLADKAGAHWLIDAIASYQTSRKIADDEMLREMQFWRFEITSIASPRHGILTCQADSDIEPVIRQKFATDFPLDRISIWVELGSYPGANGELTAGYVAMLPGER